MMSKIGSSSLRLNQPMIWWNWLEGYWKVWEIRQLRSGSTADSEWLGLIGQIMWDVAA